MPNVSKCFYKNYSSSLVEMRTSSRQSNISRVVCFVIIFTIFFYNFVHIFN